MADEPQDPNTRVPTPDPEDALNRADQAADKAAEGIAGAPAPDSAAAAALAAAMEAVSMARKDAEGASPRRPPAPQPAQKKTPEAAEAAPFRLQDLAASLSAGRRETLDLLSDVQLQVRIELGRTRMYVEDVLQLGDGAVVELDKLAGDPVDVFVNDRHVARGEVLVLNDNFCVRISEILDPGAERTA
jgi:flagellar motor switch protein FliN/FliY